MVKEYTAYHLATGRFLYIIGVAEAELPLQSIEEGHGFIDGAHMSATHYLHSGTVVPRPAIATTVSKTIVAADGVDVVSISNLPVPCTMIAQGQEIAVADGVVDLTFDLAGDFLIKVVAWPYLDYEVTIHAV